MTASNGNQGNASELGSSADVFSHLFEAFDCMWIQQDDGPRYVHTNVVCTHHVTGCLVEFGKNEVACHSAHLFLAMTYYILPSLFSCFQYNQRYTEFC